MVDPDHVALLGFRHLDPPERAPHPDLPHPHPAPPTPQHAKRATAPHAHHPHANHHPPHRRQTFPHELLPQMASALLPGGLLAFALSFDEIIVTIFTSGPEQTLPIWFYAELFRPRDRPITNVVAVIVILVTLIPILFAYRLTRGRAEE